MLKNYINDIINDNCYNEIKEDIEMLSELKDVLKKEGSDTSAILQQ